jgi:hypothetical protein
VKAKSAKSLLCARVIRARENQPKGYAKENDHLLYEKNKQVRTLLRK